MISWAAYNGRIVATRDGVAQTYDLDEAVNAAITGELYAAAADSMHPRHARLIYMPTPPSTGSTASLSSSQRVLSLRELVVNIVHPLYYTLKVACTHASADSSLSCCGSNFGALARVNITFFREVIPILWSRPRQLSNLLAALCHHRAEVWYRISGALQDLWVVRYPSPRNCP